MNEDYYARKAQYAELKLKLSQLGLTIHDKSSTKEDALMQLEIIIKKFEELENTNYYQVE
ncbi:hypothetical protein [Rossellomorea yichunensis]|uniref:hypothetical protein n=1 Tax=Rossellomorea yichunensis TaxID=3077331 RepID=UPI0028DF48E3|nr:hypothetical protein [Rossellomorea sp. YC4-1]MDT9027876.1 hypothetical protein [Rossellomorea sp. YC4-1]